MAEQPLVSVLIVNYRSTDLLRDCLDALAASTNAEDLEVIVVDNATPGFDASTLAREDLDVRFIPEDHNTTYTGGNDIAFAGASGSYVLMLNPDTRVEPEALERAIKRLDSDPTLVAMGAYFTADDGEFRPYYRRLPRVRDAPVVIIPRVLDWTPLARRYRMADASFESSTLVEQPAGAFILIRREACPEPPLDAAYFNFFSDVELCRELGRHGEIRVEPDIRCYHARGGAGLVTYEPEVRARLHHDLIWGVRRYYRNATTLGRAWVWLWALVFWVIRLAQAALGGRRALRATWAAARASLTGAPPDYSEDGRMTT